MIKKLGFNNTSLISRKISTINSRDEIHLRENIFPSLTLSNPIIASPMKDVCDGLVAKEMEDCGCCGIIHRFSTIDQQIIDTLVVKNPICAIGITGDYLDRYKELYKVGVRYYCIDVANSSSLRVKDVVIELLNIHSDCLFIVGNAMSIQGVDFWNSIKEVVGVRIGVAGGCFIEETKVNTNNGKKNINKVNIGEYVLTYDGTYQKVIGKTSRIESNRIFDINGIKCTNNHKFYVIHNKNINKINENNIHDYAEWVSAEDLSEEYQLIQITD